MRPGGERRGDFSTEDTSAASAPRAAVGTALPAGRLALARAQAEPGRTPWEQQQLSLPAPSQPGEQVARPRLPPPDTQDSTQCLPGCLNGALSGQRSRPSWRREWGTRGGGGSFLPEPRACRASEAGRCWGSWAQGFGQRPCSGQTVAAKSTGHVHLAFGGAWEGTVSSQLGVGTHRGPAPTAPRTSPTMSPKQSSTWMRPAVW